jgi:hypothetical protein
MADKVSGIVLNHGLLFGLAAAGCTVFDSSRPRFDDVYGAVVVERLKTPDAPQLCFEAQPHRDPMFGVYRAAEELLLDGLSGLLLTLDSPGLVTARLCIDAASAERALRREGFTPIDWYLETGRLFARALE